MFYSVKTVEDLKNLQKVNHAIEELYCFSGPVVLPNVYIDHWCKDEKAKDKIKELKEILLAAQNQAALMLSACAVYPEKTANEETLKIYFETIAWMEKIKDKLIQGFEIHGLFEPEK